MAEMTVNSEINTELFYSASNMAYLAQVTAEIDSGKAKLEEHELIENLENKM